jgi:hypothetical protein
MTTVSPVAKNLMIALVMCIFVVGGSSVNPALGQANQPGNGSQIFFFDPITGQGYNGYPNPPAWAVLQNCYNTLTSFIPWCCECDINTAVTCAAQFCQASGYVGGEVAECNTPPGYKHDNLQPGGSVQVLCF